GDVGGRLRGASRGDRCARRRVRSVRERPPVPELHRGAHRSGALLHAAHVPAAPRCETGVRPGQPDPGKPPDPAGVARRPSRDRGQAPLRGLSFFWCGQPHPDTPAASIPARAAAHQTRRMTRGTTEGGTLSAALAYADPQFADGPGAPAVVTATELRRRYGEGDTAVDALDGVDLVVARGELTAVMGPSGSGKSTLMHLLAGLDRPTSGRVEIDGIDITGLDDADLTKLRRSHVGFVFQFFNLLPMLDAEENVTLPLAIAGEKPDGEWVGELMSRVGLAERRKHRPSELSGGQQQRVAVARAVV